MSLIRSPRPLRPAALAIVVLLAACNRDEVSAPIVEPVSGSVTVDASTGWGYLSLDEGAVIPVAQPTTSAAWDIAFNATSVMLNGGAAGPGGVTGYCLCQNATATAAEVLAMTSQSELADFTAVTAASIPAASAFIEEGLVPAMSGWYTSAGATATAVDRSWLLRRRGTAGFAKVRVAALQSPTVATPGRVTIEYALQSTPNAPFEAPRTVTVDVPASGGVSIDLATGTATTNTTEWELRFEGYTLRVNGGVSGTGAVGAALSPQPFAAITTAATDSRAYVTDRFAGVFATNPWHRYNLQGDNRISPVFNVYLVRRGANVYKLQVTDYYGPAGEFRQISVRYEQIAN